MRLRHPRDRPPSQVSVDGQRVPVADDGTFLLPDGASQAWPREFAASYDVELNAILVDTDADDTEPSDPAPTCAGADGECSRKVDEPGDYCWQHDDEEE